MKGLPAYCESCGIVFEATGLIGGSSGAQVHMENCGTNCPKCRGSAKLADGTFQFDEDVVRLVSGSNWSRAQVAAIERAYRDIKQNKEVTPGALDALEKISPELGTAVKVIMGKYGKSAVAVFMIGLLLSKCSVNIDVDVNDLIHGHSVEASQSAHYPKR